MTILFLVILILILFLKYNKKNEYDFIKLINNWKIKYSQFKFNNKKLNEYNNKINTNLLGIKLNINVPKIYYYGKYNSDELRKYNNYVIKPINGHSSTNVYLMSNGINLFNNKKTTLENIDNIFFNKNIIIEELLKNENNTYGILDDFKIYTFRGNPEIILHKYYDYKKNDYYSGWYDYKWNKIESLRKSQKKGILTYKSENIKQMLNICKYIGTTVFKNVFVRLDFYISKDKVYLGEITPCPNAGKGFTKEAITKLNNLCKKYNLPYN